MTEPVTDLTAMWVPNVGVQLNWTAATDVTTGSHYEIYVYKLNPSVSNPGRMGYVYFSSVKPAIGKSVTSSKYSLSLPATSAVFTWADLVALGSGGNPPASVAFQIQHVDSSNSESDFASVSAYPPQAIEYSSIPHFTNNLNIDPVYGQILVNDQNTYSEVAASVEVVVGTIPGQRTLAPYFGIDDIPLSQVNVNEMAKNINGWEPRANCSVSVVYDKYNNATLNVIITNQYGGS